MNLAESRDEAVFQLRLLLNDAAMDLAVMPSWKQGTPWHLDRQREIDRCRRLLARLGADVK